MVLTSASRNRARVGQSMRDFFVERVIAPLRTGAPLRGARHQIAMPRPPRALSGAPDAPSDLETRGCSLESPHWQIDYKAFVKMMMMS